ncbi:MAG: HEAT repeat domain-containing protein [bacterium]|nr:HEAT repeat domain-containing protein [bacterium]
MIFTKKISNITTLWALLLICPFLHNACKNDLPQSEVSEEFYIEFENKLQSKTYAGKAKDLYELSQNNKHIIPVLNMLLRQNHETRIEYLGYYLPGKKFIFNNEVKITGSMDEKSMNYKVNNNVKIAIEKEEQSKWSIKNSVLTIKNGLPGKGIKTQREYRDARYIVIDNEICAILPEWKNLLVAPGDPEKYFIYKEKEIKKLFKDMENSNRDIARNAINAVRDKYIMDETVLRLLFNEFTNRYNGNKNYISDVLSIKSKDITRFMIQEFQNDKNEIRLRTEAIFILTKIKDYEALNPLIKALSDKNDDIREAVAQILDSFKKDPKIIKPLMKAAYDRNDTVAYNAVRSLGQTGHPDVFDFLVKLLNRNFYLNEMSRINSIIYAFEYLEDPRAVKVLTELEERLHKTVFKNVEYQKKVVRIIIPRIEEAKRKLKKKKRKLPKPYLDAVNRGR